MESVGAKPGISVACYEDEGGAALEGEIVLHAGFDVGDQDVPDGGQVQVVDLPIVEVAAAIYRGGDDGIVAAWEALVRWIEDSGYRLSRRLPGALPRVARRRPEPKCYGIAATHRSLSATSVGSTLNQVYAARRTTEVVVQATKLILRSHKAPRTPGIKFAVTEMSPRMGQPFNFAR